MDIPDNYELITVPNTTRGTVFLVCKDCGSLVVDTEPHERYHERMAEADRYASMLRPIG